MVAMGLSFGFSQMGLMILAMVVAMALKLVMMVVMLRPWACLW